MSGVFFTVMLLANKKYNQRQKGKRKHKKFSIPIQQELERLLRDNYSPEQVVGTLKKKGKAAVSSERIYQHIWLDKKHGGTH